MPIYNPNNPSNTRTEVLDANGKPTGLYTTRKVADDWNMYYADPNAGKENEVDRTRRLLQEQIDRMTKYGTDMMSDTHRASLISMSQRMTPTATGFGTMGARAMAGMGYSPGATSAWERAMKRSQEQTAFNAGEGMARQDYQVGAGLLGQAMSGQERMASNVQGSYLENERNVWQNKWNQDQLNAQRGTFGSFLGGLFGMGVGALTGGIGAGVGGALGKGLFGASTSGGTGTTRGGNIYYPGQEGEWQYNNTW
jgi:hypothetical protein